MVKLRYVLKQLEQRGNFPRALLEFQKVIEADPENYFALQGAASCYVNMNDLNMAVEMFERAAVLRCFMFSSLVVRDSDVDRLSIPYVNFT